MSEPGGDENIFAKLAEIAGGVKLIDHKLDASNRIQDERHERTQTDIKDLRERVHRNANALQELFGWRSQQEGKQQGLALGGKIVWTLAGAIPAGVVVAVLQLLSGH